MKYIPFALLLLAMSIASGQPAYYSDQGFHLANPSKWYPANGTLTEAAGVLKAGAGPGSIISSVPSPTGANYEIRTTYSLKADGGVFITYVRAEATSLYEAPAGDFVSVVVRDPNLTTGLATIQVVSVSGGVYSLLASGAMPAHDGMVLRIVVRDNSLLITREDMLWAWAFFISPPATDGRIQQTGVGFGTGTPSANGFSSVSLHALEYAPPAAVQNIAVSAYADQIQLSWPAVSDGAGSGVYGYHIYSTNPDGSLTYLTSVREPSTWTWYAANPNKDYRFRIYVEDYHRNWSGLTDAVVRTPGPTVRDPRRTGLKPDGTYWGGDGERLDMQSGNVNFTIPVFTAESRGGMKVQFALSHNSQMWRKDSAGVWQNGFDAGYGYGWRFMAGSIIPVYSSGLVHHYVYTDSTGAEYKLDRLNALGHWTDAEGAYVAYEPDAYKLHFNDGSFWLMGNQSVEADSGTRYPTLLQDSKGNQIRVEYDGASSRIWSIDDYRSDGCGVWTSSGRCTAYAMYDATRHLQHFVILRDFWDVAFWGSSPISSPWGQAYPAAWLLRTVTQRDTGITHEFNYKAVNGVATGEVCYVKMPYGGTVLYDFRDFTYSGNDTIREVNVRITQAGPSAPQYQWTFWHDDAGDATRRYRAHTAITDVTGGGDRMWSFDAAGRLLTYAERAAGGVVKRSTTHVWTTTANGHPYISQTKTTTYERSRAIWKKREQSIDIYGNLKWRREYDFNSETAYREWTYEYEHEANTWANLHVPRYLTRLLTRELLTAGSAGTYTLRFAEYDGNYAAGGNCPHLPAHLAHPAPLRLYEVQTQCILGIPTFVGSLTDAQSLTSYTTGVVQRSAGQDGVVTTTTAIATNYALPATITAQGQNSTVSWNFAGHGAAISGPNGLSSGVQYDAAGRIMRRSLPDGGGISYTWSGNVQFESRTNDEWTRTTVDGFGRKLKVEHGTGAATDRQSEFEYAPCACSPYGKLKRESLPHPPGQAPNWTTYSYDTLGRVTEIVHAGAVPGGPSSGKTTYEYDADTTYGWRMMTKVTVPGRRWKRSYHDSWGDLREVEEPKPNDLNAKDVTTYTYSGIGQLLTVNMVRPGRQGGSFVPAVTQTRTFTYSGAVLTSATEPETGTTTYGWRDAKRPAWKKDSAGRKTVYEYDSYSRLKIVKYFASENAPEATGERTEFYYDRVPEVRYDGTPVTTDFWASRALGRVAMRRKGEIVEFFDYTPGGQIAKKRLVVPNRDPLEISMTYDEVGRISTIKYPSGAVIHYGYTGGRPTTLETPDGAGWYKILTAKYAWNGRLESLSPSAGWASFKEEWQYNLLGQMTSYRMSSPTYTVRDVQYVYGEENDGRVQGEIENGATTSYTYDWIGRLTSGTNPSWAQSYVYDGFGNLYRKTGTNAVDLSSLLDSAKNRVGSTFSTVGNETWAANVSYDFENRLKSVPGPQLYSVTSHFYAADGRRVLSEPNGDVVLWVGDQRFGRYGPMADQLPYSAYEFAYIAGRRTEWYRQGAPSYQWSFGPRTASSDRIGCSKQLLPYGENATTIPNSRPIFATYWRDSDDIAYADQRYYAVGMGRFLTADPYKAGGGPSNPQSWNRYAYVEGDPINYVDPAGLDACRAGATCVTVTAKMPGLPASFGGGGAPGGSPLDRREDDGMYTQQVDPAYDPSTGTVITPATAEEVLEQCLTKVESDRGQRDQDFRAANPKPTLQRDGGSVIESIAAGAAAALGFLLRQPSDSSGAVVRGVVSGGLTYLTANWGNFLLDSVKWNNAWLNAVTGPALAGASECHRTYTQAVLARSPR